MSDDNDTQEYSPNPVINGIITFFEGRVKFVYGAFWFVIAIVILNAAWTEISGKKQSMVQSLTANGVVEVVDSSVWILPENSLEGKLVSDRKLYREDIIFGYTLDRRFNQESRIKSYRSKRRHEYFHLETFWDMVRDDPYFKTQDFKVYFETELLQLRKSTPAQSGSSFRNLSAPSDAPRDQRMYMGSTFDQFWVWFDRPMHALAMEWVGASGPKEIAVRYNPDNPEDFLDEATYEKAAVPRSVALTIITGCFLFTFGLMALFFSVSMLATGLKRTIQVICFITVFCTVPLWSPYLQLIMDYTGIPTLGKLILKDMAGSMNDIRSQVGFIEEMTFDKSDYTLLPIDVAHSRYKDIYGRFTLSNPTEKKATFAAAMEEISAQITSQIKQLPTGDLFTFYRVLDGHMSQQRRGWDGPLLESTKEMAVDTSRSANLRSWIISVLGDMSYARKDAELAEFMYSQYIACDEGVKVKEYWRRNNLNFYQSSSFKDDINSSDPDRIKRALNIWMKRNEFKENIEILVPRLKTLTQHPDPEIREMACKKWDSRKDLGDR